MTTDEDFLHSQVEYLLSINKYQNMLSNDVVLN